MAFDGQKITLIVRDDGSLLARAFRVGDLDLPDDPRAPVGVVAASFAKARDIATLGTLRDLAKALAPPAKASHMLAPLTSAREAMRAIEALAHPASLSDQMRAAATPYWAGFGLVEFAASAIAPEQPAHQSMSAIESASALYRLPLFRDMRERARCEDVRARLYKLFDRRKVDRLIEGADDAEHAEEMAEEEFARLDALAGREPAVAVAEEAARLAARNVPPHNWTSAIAVALRMPRRTVSRYVAAVKLAKKNGQMAT